MSEEKQEQANESNQPQVIKVGEKEYSPDQIAELESTANKAKAILDTAGRYGLSVEDYLTNSDMAFHTISDLIEQGIVDKEGRVLAKDNPAPSAPQSSGIDLSGIDSQQDRGALGGVLKRVEAMEKALQGISPTLQQLQTTTNNITRQSIASDIKKQYPGLTDQDIGRVFADAMKDRSVDLWGHAKAHAERKESASAEYKRKVLQEYGLDPDELEARNKLRQQGEGGAGQIFKGKKISFRANGKDAVSPLHASMQYLRMKGELEK